MELPLNPSPDHAEFDHLCARLEEFEPLPSPTAAADEPKPEHEDESSLDGQILAALVSPY